MKGTRGKPCRSINILLHTPWSPMSHEHNFWFHLYGLTSHMSYSTISRYILYVAYYTISITNNYILLQYLV